MTAEEDQRAGSPALARDAGELYAAALADFVPTRTRLAKQARGEKDRERARQLQAMRKPTVAAWLVNQVVRHHPSAVERMRELGARMRHAQAALDAEALSRLRGERDAALAELQAAAAAVAEEAQQPMTRAAAEEVRETGIAALADAAAEEAAWSGTLTRGLSYSGFGEVDVSDAVVRTGTGTVLRRLEGGGDKTEDAEEPADSEAVGEPAGVAGEPEEDEPAPEDDEGPQEQAEKPEPGVAPAAEDALGRVLARLRRAAEELEAQAEALGERAAQARERLAQREHRVEEVEEEVAAARERLDQARAARDAAATELAGLEREREDVVAQHASAAEEVTATERALGGSG